MNIQRLTIYVLFICILTTPCWSQFPTGRPVASESSREINTVNDAIVVLDEIMKIPAQAIPASMLSKAEGLVIVPGMVKGGLGIGGAFGRGIFLTRQPGGGEWEPPVFISMTNGSFGFQIGLQAIDVVLVFNTPKSVEAFKKGKFTIGADAAVTAGPVGREASIGTDISLKSEIFSYSRTKGLFLGATIKGGIISIDHESTTRFFAGGPQAIGTPKPVTRLLSTLNRYSGVKVRSADEMTSADDADSYPPIAPQTINTGNPPSYSDDVINQPYSEGNNNYNNEPGNNYSGNPGNETYPPIPPAPSGQPPYQPGAHQQNGDMRPQLKASYANLIPHLDPQWQAYLALPSEVYNEPGSPQPSPEVVRLILSRYDTIAQSDQYRELSSKPQFQTVHQQLRQYSQSLPAPAQMQQNR